jgi:hypothetical protein
MAAIDSKSASERTFWPPSIPVMPALDVQCIVHTRRYYAARIDVVHADGLLEREEQHACCGS